MAGLLGMLLAVTLKFSVARGEGLLELPAAPVLFIVLLWPAGQLELLQLLHMPSQPIWQSMECNNLHYAFVTDVDDSMKCQTYNCSSDRVLISVRPAKLLHNGVMYTVSH